MSVVTCRNLGGIGRVGNQLHLYVFAKAYAERYGAELQTSDWVGRKLFVNATEPLVEDMTLPQTRLDSEAVEMGLPLDRYFGRVNIDLRVYAQHQCYAFYTRTQAREWLKLKPEYEAFAPRECPGTVAHIRKPDAVDNESFNRVYCSLTEDSYDAAMEFYGIPGPVTKVFAGWRPDHPDLPPELSWLPDFLMLRDASHLLRANSTFSFFAGVLSRGRVYSPLVRDLVGLHRVPFCEGNFACPAGRFKNQSDIFLRE